MLQELRVENLLLIERAELRLAPGLNVITGETGAGKTVLAHALDLLLGGRARPGIVRPGASEAYVEGVFELPAALRDQLGERLGADADALVLARRVGADGRTRAYLGGRAATVAELRDVGGALLSFYGQHEHRKLTVASAQLKIVDSLCGGEHAERLQACAQAHRRARELEARARDLGELAGERERELDLLEYELAEIDTVEPDESERERLLSARERLRRGEALARAAAAGVAALAPDAAERPGAANLGAGALVTEALAELQAQAGADPALDALGERMCSLAIEIADLATELRDYAERGALADLDIGDADTGDPSASLARVEERLAAVERLMRKHGGSVASVLAFAEGARARRDELAGADEALADTERELDAVRGELEAVAGALREERAAAAGAFAAAVREQLAELAMADASFEVSFSERAIGPDGGDAVDFLIAPNPGVPAGPVRDIASGGELSRVMLAIMSVAGASASVSRTLVFDEVDAGVGGHTARAVGARLQDLAGAHQVLCITHLPQIASLGERHFAIAKDTSADPTRTTVVELREPDVVSELVRMLGADSDDATARRHARDLRRAA
jgi:DNA repair protein RecN (Recombination protein N)